MVELMTCGYLMTVGADVAIDRLGPYSAALPPLYEEFGGHYLAKGGPGRGVEAFGDAPPRSVMLARFPSIEAVRAFWTSPGYRAAVPLREGCGIFNVYAFEGPALAPGAETLRVGIDNWEYAGETPFVDEVLPEILEGSFTNARIRLWAVAPGNNAALGGEAKGYDIPFIGGGV